MRMGLLLVFGACTPEEPVPEVITWDTPVEASWVGMPVGDDIVGHSLRDIVSGAVEARGEGRTCSACHFAGSVTLYRPEVDQYGIGDVGPYTILDGRNWAGATGWAMIFAGMGEGAFVEKPPELREAFRLWAEAERERVEPVRWSEPVHEDNAGGPPDPAIEGKSLDDVLNSRVSGRPDDLLCSVCHYEDGPYPYRPPIAQGATSSFTPDTVLDGRPWSGANGWAMVFAELGGNETFHKPDYLRSVFFKWVDDGGW